MNEQEIKRAWRKLYTSLIVGCGLVVLGISLSFKGHQSNSSSLITIIVGSAAIFVSLLQMRMFKNYLNKNKENE